jgi:peroxiredoxin
MMSASSKHVTDENHVKKPPVVLIAGLGVLFLILGAFLIGSTFVEGDQAAEAPAAGERGALPLDGPPLQVGDRPYAFTLANVDGEQVALSDHMGQPIILNFWATWCGPCRIEMPELQAAYEANQDQGLVILALDRDESAQTVSRFFDELNLTFTPLLDDGGEVARRYGVGGNLPASIFINPEGQITAIHRGLMDQNLIEAYLAETIPAG